MNETNNFSLAVNPAEAQTTAVQLVSDDDTNFIVDLTSRTTSYCSMVAETTEEKALLYNAMNNTERRLKDCINEVIEVKDVFVEAVNCTNEETGEVTRCPRTVLIDVNGVGYQAVSLGIFSALKKLFAVYGEPQDWTAPLKLKVKQISRSAKKNILTLDVVA